MSKRAILDASALLALLNAEPGGELVAERIPGAMICSVNLAEVVGKLSDNGMPEDAVQSALSGLDLEVASFDHELAWLAGLLQPQTKKIGLSLADRSCIALGLKRKLPLMTTDRVWKKVKLRDSKIEVVVIR